MVGGGGGATVPDQWRPYGDVTSFLAAPRHRAVALLTKKDGIGNVTVLLVFERLFSRDIAQVLSFLASDCSSVLLC